MNHWIQILNFKKFVEKCVLCEKCTETRYHVFVSFPFTKKMFEENIRIKLNNKNCYNKVDLILNCSLDENDVRIISIFKMSIWSFRNLLKKEKSANDKHILFRKIFFKKFLSLWYIIHLFLFKLFFFCFLNLIIWIYIFIYFYLYFNS